MDRGPQTQSVNHRRYNVTVGNNIYPGDWTGGDQRDFPGRSSHNCSIDLQPIVHKSCNHGAKLGFCVTRLSPKCLSHNTTMHTTVRKVISSKMKDAQLVHNGSFGLWPPHQSVPKPPVRMRDLQTSDIPYQEEDKPFTIITIQPGSF